jgi:hypothetical protein
MYEILYDAAPLLIILGLYGLTGFEQKTSEVFIPIIIGMSIVYLVKERFLLYITILFLNFFIPYIYCEWYNIKEWIYNGINDVKDNIIFVFTNKWIMLFASFFLITIFGNFTDRDEIYMIIILLYVLYIHIFIIIDSTSNSYDFERNKGVIYLGFLNMIFIIPFLFSMIKEYVFLK